MRTMANHGIRTSVDAASSEGFQKHCRHLCVFRIRLMGVDAYENHVGLLPRLFYLFFNADHVRLKRPAFNPVFLVQNKHILSKRKRSLFRRIFISVLYRILHGGIDLCHRRQLLHLFEVFPAYMVNGLKSQRIQTRPSLHICRLSAGHPGFVEGCRSAD